MDARAFVEALKGPIGRRLGADYELRIDSDELPEDVEFTVISGQFEGMDPADRIQFLADVVEAALGLPLEFRPMGLALTPAEDQSGEWDDSREEDDLAYFDDESSVGRPQE